MCNRNYPLLQLNKFLLVMFYFSSFIGRFTSSLCKCKPISPVAAQQLLVDAQTLHSVLLGLPSIGSSINRKAPLSYTKLVTSGMTAAENILKAVMADHSDPEQFIHNFKTLLPDGDADVFKKVKNPLSPCPLYLLSNSGH